MSDFSHGPGWWQASDGKWYPPDAYPAQPYAPHVYPTAYGYQPNQPQGPPQAFPLIPPPKKFYEQVWFWILAVVVVLLGILGSFFELRALLDKSLNARHTIVYSVSGSGTANITYVVHANVNNGAASADGVALPWTKTVTGQGLFGIYSVGADLVTGTSISCKITIDGSQVASETSTGVGTSVDCTAGP